ncbi:MAG: crosslink repair DNA glycosylase YcaQ family protein [Parvularculales bacterium]
MSSPLIVTNRQARRWLIHLSGLSCSPVGRVGGTKVLKKTIHQLGFVQLDSINTVERAHHLILFSRNHAYRREDLTHLLEKERSLFEHWTHDASVIPCEFYPHWQHRFAASRRRLTRRWENRLGPEPERVIAHVRRRITKEGPLMVRDFDDAHKGVGGWWGWGPSKTALEYLWHTGVLAIAGRQGFQKRYDLARRVIPSEYNTQKPKQAETVDWLCRMALERLGFATPRDLAAFWNGVSVDEARRWVEINKGRTIIEIMVDSRLNHSPQRVVVPCDIEDRLHNLPPVERRLRLLSPFDPLVRDRQRLSRVFGFDYRIEVFVPVAKRRYGYYVLPVLEGDRFIGRIDLKANRKAGILEVKGLWLEAGEKMTKIRSTRVVDALKHLADFTGCEAVTGFQI